MKMDLKCRLQNGAILSMGELMDGYTTPRDVTWALMSLILSDTRLFGHIFVQAISKETIEALHYRGIQH